MSGYPIASQRREMLAEKARQLYGKYCGTGGRGICAESFVVYHIGRGETIVAEDLLAFLETVVSELELSDPHNRLNATRGLVARIEKHLAEAIDSHGAVKPEFHQTGPALRDYVKGCSKV